jgi:hypothetical protein
LAGISPRRAQEESASAASTTMTGSFKVSNRMPNPVMCRQV